MEIQNQANRIRRWFLSKVLNISPNPPPSRSLLHKHRTRPPSISPVTQPADSLSLSLSTEIKSEDDLLPPGAEPGTVPTDLDQSTGLERFEILGKMQGVDVFDMKPLDASRKGTALASITTVKSFILMDHTTLVGSTLCECGRKTWRGCVGGGWCPLYGTWRMEGTTTEREVREWKVKNMIANGLIQSGEIREC